MAIAREDVKKQLITFYSTKDKEVTMYELPQLNYIQTKGVGERNIYRMYEYKQLWTMNRFVNRVKHYTIEDLIKNFSRMPLEMEWEDARDQEVNYKARFVLPSYVNDVHYIMTMKDLNNRLGEIPFELALDTQEQGKVAQLLHRGCYDDIHHSIHKLQQSLQDQGYTLKGNHREIFLNHPHCNPPEKLQILLRQYIE